MTSRLDKASAAVEEVRDHVSRQPYVTLGVALGIGYLVGRGFSMKVLSTVLGMSARVALGSAVESYLRDPSALTDRQGSRNRETIRHAPRHRKEHFAS